MSTRRPRPTPVLRAAFGGFCFPPEVILLAVRWYLRFRLSYRDVEELLTERGVEVDHVTVYRWLQRFTPLLAEAARPCRHRAGDRWFVDETSLKVAGRWRYVHRAVDQFGQVIDVFASPRRCDGGPPVLPAGDWRATNLTPTEVTTDTPPVYSVVPEGLRPRRGIAPTGTPTTASEGDHGRLKARLRPMRGLKQECSARVIIAGHAFAQNVRRGHYELAADEPASRRLAAAFAELVVAI